MHNVVEMVGLEQQLVFLDTHARTVTHTTLNVYQVVLDQLHLRPPLLRPRLRQPALLQHQAPLAHQQLAFQVEAQL